MDGRKKIHPIVASVLELIRIKKDEEISESSADFLVQLLENSQPIEGHENAGVDATDDEGDSILYNAAQQNLVHLVKALIEHNVNVNAQEEETALFTASDCGHAKVITLLIEAKADVNKGQIGGSREYSSLMAAAYSKHTDIMRQLILAGAELDPNLLDTCFLGSTDLADLDDQAPNINEHVPTAAKLVLTGMISQHPGAVFDLLSDPDESDLLDKLNLTFEQQKLLVQGGVAYDENATFLLESKSEKMESDEKSVGIGLVEQVQTPKPTHMSLILHDQYEESIKEYLKEIMVARSKRDKAVNAERAEMSEREEKEDRAVADEALDESPLEQEPLEEELVLQPPADLPKSVYRSQIGLTFGSVAKRVVHAVDVVSTSVCVIL